MAANPAAAAQRPGRARPGAGAARLPEAVGGIPSARPEPLIRLTRGLAMPGICRRLSPTLVLLLGACQLAAAPAASDAPPARLHLPAGFAIEEFAKVPGARSLLVAEGGARIYVATRDSAVYAILDPERDGRANQVVAVAGGLKVPNGLALAPDGSLLIAEQHRIIDLDPSGRAKVIVPPGVLPDQSHHGWRYAGLGPDGKLYVAIGAPCNICEVKGFEGTIIRLRPDGNELEIFARGIRNSVGFDWQPATGELFFTDNGGDNLGDDIPPDELNRAPSPASTSAIPTSTAAMFPIRSSRTSCRRSR